MPLRVILKTEGVNRFLTIYKKIALNINLRIRRILNDFGNNVIRTVKKERLSGRPGLLTRSGELASSFRFAVSPIGTTPTIRFFSTSKYASIHESGGVITPTKGSKLAIPVDEGVRARYHSPLKVNHPELVPFRCRMLIDTNTHQVTHFLVNSVYIPPRLKFEETVRKLLPKLARDLGNKIAAFVESDGRL